MIQVVHVPNEMQSDAALESAINALEPPYKAIQISIGHEIGSLPDKIEVRPGHRSGLDTSCSSPNPFLSLPQDQQKAVETLEKCLVKYLKGDKLGKKRPTTSIGPWWKLWGKEKRVSATGLSVWVPPF